MQSILEYQQLDVPSKLLIFLHTHQQSRDRPRHSECVLNPPALGVEAGNISIRTLVSEVGDGSEETHSEIHTLIGLPRRTRIIVGK